MQREQLFGGFFKIDRPQERDLSSTVRFKQIESIEMP